ncbi:hypothetical protein LPJ61_000989 [Coemansia biformis]|uniref:snRNA-activating protein complex subunit 3 n=1 Tax=Coemansia biformis TaxID=1286918 RepID=A0A9W7YIL2_9FUNG|nr:hypothetical protein LPJ61_000989 [Coemansia biformis]
MPPSELISVRAFRDKYAGLVRNQRECGLFSTQAGWSEEAQAEVAHRCQIVDDLSFSNAAFVNPTLFHMLRQHREFNEATERELLQKKRESATELERRRREREAELQTSHAGLHGGDAELYESDTEEPHGRNIQHQPGQAGHDANGLGYPGTGEGLLGGYEQGSDPARVTAAVAGNGDFGDASMLLAVDVDQDGAELGAQAMDVDTETVEDALARLASATAGGQRAAGDVPNAEDAGKGRDSDSQGARADNSAELLPADASPAGDQGSGGDGDGFGGFGGAGDGCDLSGVGDDDDDLYSDDHPSDGEYAEEGRARARPARNMSVGSNSTKNREEVMLHTPLAELPQGITEDMLKAAIAKSGFSRSDDVEETMERVTKQRVRVEEPTEVSELESRFRNVKTHLDESTLAALRKANRRMVPPKYRLEVNFMTNRVVPAPAADDAPAPVATPVADDEVILSVCFYNTRSSTAKMEEYLVLGSQSLTVLRDVFYCISDFLVSHRDEKIENTKDRKVSSSYFFIEKTFYNDMRSPTATDYSRVIMEWASDPERQEKNPKLRGLQSRLMDGARFLDLSIRLKQPYTFVHQGDCEHIMMFTDLRLLGPKDDQNVEAYPKQIFRTRHMRHKCRMCSAYPAQYVTKNDFHSGMSPCYFCEKCYTPFHFDTDDKRLLEHDVFPYANVNLM